MTWASRCSTKLLLLSKTHSVSFKICQDMYWWKESLQPSAQTYGIRVHGSSCISLHWAWEVQGLPLPGGVIKGRTSICH